METDGQRGIPFLPLLLFLPLSQQQRRRGGDCPTLPLVFVMDGFVEESCRWHVG